MPLEPHSFLPHPSPSHVSQSDLSELLNCITPLASILQWLLVALGADLGLPYPSIANVLQTRTKASETFKRTFMYSFFTLFPLTTLPFISLLT